MPPDDDDDRVQRIAEGTERILHAVSTRSEPKGDKSGLAIVLPWGTLILVVGLAITYGGKQSDAKHDAEDIKRDILELRTSVAEIRESVKEERSARLTAATEIRTETDSKLSRYWRIAHQREWSKEVERSNPTLNLKIPEANDVVREINE